MAVDVRLVGVHLHGQVLARVQELEQQRKPALGAQLGGAHDLRARGLDRRPEAAAGQRAVGDDRAAALDGLGQVGQFPRLPDHGRGRQRLAQVGQVAAAPDFFFENRLEDERVGLHRASDVNEGR